MLVEDYLQQITNRTVFLNCMTQMRLCIYNVMVAAALSRPLDDARFLQLTDEPKRGALGDANPVRHVAKTCVGVVGEANKHVGVIAEKGPVVGCLCHKPRVPGVNDWAQRYDIFNRKSITRQICHVKAFSRGRASEARAYRYAARVQNIM
jgi:hypothetical protein